MANTPKTIAIVGGGISGLAAALRAVSVAPSAKVCLFESSPEFGGVLKTESTDGYMIEHSADMFTTEPDVALELCKELGREDELITTIPTDDRAFVATADAIHPVPRGLSLMLPTDLDAIVSSPLLDDETRTRFLAEENVPPRDSDEDESLESFAVRRFGQSFFDNLIQPLVSGIYTADPKKLSMKATISRFLEMEKKNGSLIAAGRARKSQHSDNATSGARYGIFRAPKNGMGDLVKWMVDSLEQNDDVTLKTATQVASVSQSENGWSIQLNNSSCQNFDAVVISTPSSVSANLIRQFDQSISDQLSSITAASSAIVVLGFDRQQLQTDFRGYGIIDPSILNRNVIATSFSSNKFPGRAPEGKMLTRTFIGGALQSDLVDLDDQALVEMATGELNKTVGFEGTPELTRVFRWKNCMPQYHLGHVEHVDELENQIAGIPNLEFCGKSFRGVGIPACIESGFASIDRLMN